MKTLTLIGLGLHDESGISLRGLEEAKTAEHVFIELYTNLMPNLSLDRLEHILGKKPVIVSRKDLEENNGKIVLEAAKKGKTVLLVPGDPLIATTHVALRLEAKKQNIKTLIIHGTSILSAIIGLSGLHSYKFGKSVTIPFPDENPSETPYEAIRQNKQRGLHTLCLLDVKAEEKRYLTIREALNSLIETEKRRKKQIISPNTLAVGVARAGSPEPTVKAGPVGELLCYDFDGPPHSLVFPGKLHFIEAEALITFAEAPQNLREKAA
ncbi:MAG: diphthine synthase [Candidatus Bathyarchaeia archaeon]